MKVLNTIKKGEFCVLRITHTSTFANTMISSQYDSFKIVIATKVNKAGQVTMTENAAGSPLTKWAYCYAIGDMQAEAAHLFDENCTDFDKLAEIKMALLTAKETLTNRVIALAEIQTEHALGIR